MFQERSVQAATGHWIFRTPLFTWMEKKYDFYFPNEKITKYSPYLIYYKNLQLFMFFFFLNPTNMAKIRHYFLLLKGRAILIHFAHFRPHETTYKWRIPQKWETYNRCSIESKIKRKFLIKYFLNKNAMSAILKSNVCIFSTTWYTMYWGYILRINE